MQPAAMPRILIVDDDRALCALLAEYLRREGFVVDVAHDSEAALAQLRNPTLRQRSPTHWAIAACCCIPNMAGPDSMRCSGCLA